MTGVMVQTVQKTVRRFPVASRGADRGEPAPQIMVYCKGDSACASHHSADCGIQCHRSWRKCGGDPAVHLNRGTEA